MGDLLTIFTDGSCSGNPGPGGYAVVIYDDNDNFLDCYTHFEEKTTNNRQEMKAILYAFLKYGKKKQEQYSFDEFDNDSYPVVYSDSSYCVSTFTEWMFKWQQYGWIKTDRKEPQNLDLIKAYYEHWKDGYRIDLKKVSGHAGLPGNELADRLATGRILADEARRINYGRNTSNSNYS